MLLTGQDAYTETSLHIIFTITKHAIDKGGNMDKKITLEQALAKAGNCYQTQAFTGAFMLISHKEVKTLINTRVFSWRVDEVGDVIVTYDFRG